MRLKNWCTGYWSRRILRRFGCASLTRQQLYNVINGRSAATLVMAVPFEGHSAAALTYGLGCRPRMTSRKGASAERRSPCAVSRGRFKMSDSRPALVEKVADRRQ
jgi:hypothetical protein